MKTKTSIWMRRLAGLSALCMVFTSFVGQASARILFQDDTVGEIYSDSLNIGSNDAGVVNTSIKFGADSTAAENGNINWNITTNTFEVDHTTAITGGLSADGQVNFSGSTGTRLRENADPNTNSDCAVTGEVIVNTTANTIMICTTTGTPGVWTTPAPAVPTGPANPGTCSAGQLFFNTTSATLQVCTTANTWGTAGPQDLESVYTKDADKTLSITDNLATGFAINEGANNYLQVVTTNGSEAVNVNSALNANGAVTLGDNGDTVAVNSSDWDISTTGAMTGISGITNDSTLTTSGGAVNVNASSNFATNINTGTSTGAVSIGGGSNTVSIDTTSWDISSAGVASGLTGITSTGTVNFSGAGAFRTREIAGITNPGTACTTTGELIMDTADNTLYVCTNAGTDAWSKVASGGDATTLDGIDSTQFLRSDTSDNFTSGTLTFDNGTTLAVNGVANIGDGGDAITVNSNTWDISGAGVASGFTGLTTGGTVSLGDNTGTVAINSSDWDISTTGAMTGIGAITMDGLLTGTAGATLSGAAINLNASSNFATNIGTGTTTATVSIGGGANSVGIDSATWDISTAGAASGFTTITGSGDITTTGGDIVIGTIGLNDVGVSNITSGASLVGAYDEFDNSSSTTVQDILDDFDALIGSNADNVEVLTFHPEYPDTVVWPDGSANAGTLSSAYDDTNDENYYHWTSNNGATQDMDLKFRFALPADYTTTGDLTFRFRTGSAVEADNDIEIRVYNATDETAGNPTLCGSDTTNVSAAAWATGTITGATLDTGCTGGTALSAGDIVEVDVKLYDNNGGADYSDVGYVSLAYSN